MESQELASPVAGAKLKLLKQLARPQVDMVEIQPLMSVLTENWQRPASEAELAVQLDGLWELLYTSTPALARSSLDIFPGVERGRTFQSIDVAAGRLYNLAELTGLGMVRGTVLVSARFRLTALTRAEVSFEETAIIWGELSEFGSVPAAIERIARGEGLGLRLPIRGEGSVETLYIDADFRIGLGNRGTIFILRREGS